MNPIPPITHPFGRYWRQPDTSTFIFLGDTVIMPQASLDLLADYSHSRPSGAYPGKCWKSQNRSTGEWFLLWFSDIAGDPEFLFVHTRKVILKQPARLVTHDFLEVF